MAWSSARSPMICLPSGPQRMTRPFTRLLHLGNVVVDVVLEVPVLPEPGGDVLATASQSAAGGGVNVMAAAARPGLAVADGGVVRSGPVPPPAPGAWGGRGGAGAPPAQARAGPAGRGGSR